MRLKAFYADSQSAWVWESKPDRGFKVFKLQSSNFKGWQANLPPGDVSKLEQQLEMHVGQPIEFVQATNPIVIIDEPQSVDNTDKAQEARTKARTLAASNA